MRLHALFVPALFVLYAHAASIPESEPLLEESLPTKPLDKILLRDAPTEIPVKVIEDSQPAENLISLEDEKYQVKRDEVDLSNLSPPAHQNEHDTQSPEKYNDDKISESTIKQSLSETQNVFNQGLQKISQNVQTFFTENEQATALQNAIQNMKETLAEQVNKLNSTIQNFWNLQGSSTRSTFDINDKNSPIYKVQCDLKKLEETFQERLNSLSNSVQEAANSRQSLRADANGASTQPAAGATGENQNQNPSNFVTIVMNSIQNIQQQWNQGINSISSQFQNLFNPGGQGGQSNGSPPNSANPQSGTNGGSQGIGGFVNGIWQNFQTIINPNGQGSTQTQQSPPQNNNNNIFAGIQNIPFVQGVVNFFNPNKPQDTTPATTTAPQKPEGQNVAPSVSQEYDSVDNNKNKPSAQPSPIQRIQGSVTPVVTFKDAAEVETAEEVAPQGDLKYGFGPKPHNGDGGDNNDSSGSRVKDIPLEVDATLATADVQPEHLVQTEEVATDLGRSLKRFY